MALFIDVIPTASDDCCQFARLRCEEQLVSRLTRRYQISALLHSYPPGVVSVGQGGAAQGYRLQSSPRVGPAIEALTDLRPLLVRVASRIRADELRRYVYEFVMSILDNGTPAGSTFKSNNTPRHPRHALEYFTGYAATPGHILDYR